MFTRLGRSARLLALACGVGAVAAAPAVAAPMTFLDAGAWLNAVSALPGQGLVQMPGVANDRMLFSDGHGEWTLDNHIVTYESYDEGLKTVSRLQYVGAPQSFDGGFSVIFGCTTTVFPCLGLRTIEIELDYYVSGFGGEILYHLGSLEITNGPSIIPIPLLEKAFIAGLDHIHGDGPTLFPGYDGFFGAIFDSPTKIIRLAWLEHTSSDDYSSVKFTNTFLVSPVTVPEPASALLLSAGLLPLFRARRPRKK